MLLYKNFKCFSWKKSHNQSKMAEDKVGAEFAKYTTDKEIRFLIYFKTVKIKGGWAKRQKNNEFKAQAKNLWKRYTMVLSHTQLFQFYP